MESFRSDKELWIEFKAGDEYALSDLYKKHYLGLINYGIKLTGNRQYANDCFIEVLLSLYERRSKLADVENVKSYLMTCLRTTIFQHLRSEKIRAKIENQAVTLLEEYEFSYEDYLGKSQTDDIIKARISKSLSKLTVRQKELLQLKFFENLNYDEIAFRCGISKRTAYNIIYNSLKILKEDMEGNNGMSFHSFLPFIIAILSSSAIKISLLH